MIRIFFVMLLLHVVAEFVLQPVALLRIKQKTYWEQPEHPNGGKDASAMAIAINAILWSVMIMLPLMYYSTEGDLILLLVFLVNMLVHAYIDEYTTNRHKLTFVTAQSLYLLQLIITFLVTLLIQFI